MTEEQLDLMEELANDGIGLAARDCRVIIAEVRRLRAAPIDASADLSASAMAAWSDMAKADERRRVVAYLLREKDLLVGKPGLKAAGMRTALRLAAHHIEAGAHEGEP